MSEPLAFPLHLPAREVALAAKAALDARKLSAQTTRGLACCSYRDPKGAPCAIGAALSDAYAERFDRLGVTAGVSVGATVGTLVAQGHLTSDDADALGKLQKLHDTWSFTESPYARRKARAAFVRHLNQMLAQPAAGSPEKETEK
jgi:hypothetical protein